MAIRETRPPGAARATDAGIDGRNELSVVFSRLFHLLGLEIELGLAELRQIALTAAIAAAVAVASLIVLLASIVVLVTGAFAPLFGAPWEPFVVAGGGFLLLSAAGIGWSVWRVKHIRWPEKTVRSLEEMRRWLGAQLRSKLTLR